MARNHIRIQIVYDTDPCYLSWLLPTWLLPGTRMEFELHSPSRRGELSNGWEESVSTRSATLATGKSPCEANGASYYRVFLVLFFSLFSPLLSFLATSWNLIVMRYPRMPNNCVSVSWRNIANNIVNELDSFLFRSIVYARVRIIKMWDVSLGMGYHVRN